MAAAPTVSTISSSIRTGIGALSMSSNACASSALDVKDEYPHTPDGKLVYGNTTVAFDPKQGKSWAIQKRYAFFGVDDQDSKKKAFCNFTYPSGRRCYHMLLSPDKSTGNINHHLKNIHKITKNSPGKGEQAPALPGSLDNYWTNANSGGHYMQTTVTFSKELFRDCLLEYVIESAAPFLTVKQKSLQRLLFLAHQAPSLSSLQLPSPSTIIRDLKQLYSNMKSMMTDELQDQERLAYTVDGWTTPSMKASFLAVTAHWIDERWKSCSVTIGFEKITGAHTGHNLADIVHKVLQDYQLTSKPFHITMDNAANMDILASSLEAKIQNSSIFTAAEGRIHCIGHIINLASQAALTAIQADSSVMDEDQQLFDSAENDTMRLDGKSMNQHGRDTVCVSTYFDCRSCG